MATLAFALGMVTACQREEAKADLTPLPTVAAPPYICDHIPLRAVELMTGVHEPQFSGSFDLTPSNGDGSCLVRRSDGEHRTLLSIVLLPLGGEAIVKDHLQQGATPLPEIAPGTNGYYSRNPGDEYDDGHAVLARGEAHLIVELTQGAEGRDHAADVAALMKLIGPKLLKVVDPTGPSPKTPSVTKD
ncbi:hypothetical protein ACQP1K_08565 [Sphaerimonospora sp. CA-214678]|uniref:hypothetical protein n=1 Tax=Sphaerimonospora sp. CA-214678 TaxID=3240029 RepID=UPI003D90B678